MPDKAETSQPVKKSVSTTIEGIIEVVDSQLKAENSKIAARNTKIKKLGRGIVRGSENATDIEPSEEQRLDGLSTTRNLLTTVHKMAEVAEVQHDEEGNEFLSIKRDHGNGVTDELAIRKVARATSGADADGISLLLSRNGVPIGRSLLHSDGISWADPQLPPREQMLYLPPGVIDAYVRRDMAPLMPREWKLRD